MNKHNLIHKIKELDNFEAWQKAQGNAKRRKAPKKHNGLFDYIEAQKEINPKLELIVGIIIPVEIENDNWSFRYCQNRISNTNDLTGWDFFNAVEINKGK